ncbi:BlaI/MecI/CopY family transcriptional regulator [Paenibacillus sp. P96]|uniref:BlaI/MecI/CopY family transcriptional regulator n=1 Tax=Paenibacillus zeirhizosphaerae TaxID=2987519 RepID=A0ABT9FX47_9BACL|nr:BlaI/MecI/CopY family transcriptional regulator [Paenibacillus sp. P96]MDP4099042.1 BlaI/MecI/CopY family transcriptional regulator [Paenibacillus sp. P96]
MKELPQISEAEFEVMKVIWNHAPISTNEVIEKLVKTSTWSPKTIQTLLLRLVKKKALTYKKESRVFVYTPLIQEDEYIEHESKSFLNRFYNGTLNSMVLNFLEHDQMSKEDIDELRKILDDRFKKGDGS